MKLKKLAYPSASVFLTLGDLGATAFAETKWAPPAEIAGKAKEEAAAAGAPAAKADVEKTCAAEADAKALKGRARKHFVA
ncbi:MAG: PsiF family protein, partial [Methylocystis sp.]